MCAPPTPTSNAQDKRIFLLRSRAKTHALYAALPTFPALDQTLDSPQNFGNKTRTTLPKTTMSAVSPLYKHQCSINGLRGTQEVVSLMDIGTTATRDWFMMTGKGVSIGD
ncbi:unnamed protein product [Mortierella alpina]